MTSETQKIELVETRVEDHLDEDKPIRGQKYVLLSFISPEDAIINKDVLYFSKFIESFSNNVKEIFNNIKDKYPDSKDMIDKAFNYNIIDMLVKPFSVSDVVRVVEKTLGFKTN